MKTIINVYHICGFFCPKTGVKLLQNRTENSRNLKCAVPDRAKCVFNIQFSSKLKARYDGH